MGGAVGSVDDRFGMGWGNTETSWRTAQREADKWYIRSSETFSFQEAEQYCNNMNSGLAMPGTEAAVNDIKDMFDCEYHALCKFVKSNIDTIKKETTMIETYFIIHSNSWGPDNIYILPTLFENQ